MQRRCTLSGSSMGCLPSMPKRAWRIWTTLRATPYAAKELPRYWRRLRPQLPRRVLQDCPPAPWPKPRITPWRFGRNLRASSNTRNWSGATTSPKPPCVLWPSVAKTGSTLAASKPDPKSPPSSPSSKPAAASTSPCAITWPLSSPASPTRPSTASPNSRLPHGPSATSNLHTRPPCQPCRCSDAYDSVIFSDYVRSVDRAEDVLRFGLPEDRRAAKSWLQFLIQAGHLGDAQRTWDWVVGHGYADNSSAR